MIDMHSTNSIKIAILGVGNCASSLIQGIEFYRQNPTLQTGLNAPVISNKRVTDIQVVLAFDIDARKVGQKLHRAIFALPNNSRRLVADMPSTEVTVKMGTVLDGCATHLDSYPESQRIQRSNKRETSAEAVVDLIKTTKADIVVNYLPVGSELATKFYAECSLKAGAAFLNCMPVFLASDTRWRRKFAAAGLPIIGDDIKAQLGATIVHRSLTRLCALRGITLTSSYQLNTGGNADFLNMLNQDRLHSKRISKTEAVTSQLHEDSRSASLHIGPSDYVPWLNDQKVCYIRMEGCGFAAQPVELDVKLLVEDSPNAAGVAVDAIRVLYLAKQHGLHGALTPPSAVFCKRPPRQYPDSEALELYQKWLKKLDTLR